MNHLGTKILKTERLILRPFQLADAEAMFRNWASDPDVTRFLACARFTGGIGEGPGGLGGAVCEAGVLSMGHCARYNRRTHRFDRGGRL